jgi:hypothetical protein
MFSRRNNFTGRARTTGDDVKQLADLHTRKGSHLFNAMLAVGAMYAAKTDPSIGCHSRREKLLIAFQYYSYSIEALREAIDAVNDGAHRRLRRRGNEQVCILWTTFFLGVFEVRAVSAPRTETKTERSPFSSCTMPLAMGGNSTSYTAQQWP